MAGGEFYKVPADTFQTLVMDAGIIVDEFTPSTGVIGNILGATTGGMTFNSNPTYEDFGEDVDNIPPNTWQMKRVTSYDPALNGTYVTITAALAGSLSGAGAFATGDSTHFVPNHVLVEEDFDDIWFIANYTDKNAGTATAGFVAIHLMNAMNTSGFQMTTTKAGKGQFAFDYHAHYDMTDPDTVPFEIYVKAGTAPTP